MPTGVDVNVLVIDVPLESLPGLFRLTDADLPLERLLGFGTDPDVMPDASLLMQLVQEWLEGSGTWHLLLCLLWIKRKGAKDVFLLRTRVTGVGRNPKRGHQGRRAWVQRQKLLPTQRRSQRRLHKQRWWRSKERQCRLFFQGLQLRWWISKGADATNVVRAQTAPTQPLPSIL